MRQTFEAFPGGLRRLARLTGEPYTNLRRMRDGALRKVPWDALRKLLELGNEWAGVPGCAGLSADELRKHLQTLFGQAQLERDALGGAAPHRKPGAKGRRVYA